MHSPLPEVSVKDRERFRCDLLSLFILLIHVIADIQVGVRKRMEEQLVHLVVDLLDLSEEETDLHSHLFLVLVSCLPQLDKCVIEYINVDAERLEQFVLIIDLLSTDWVDFGTATDDLEAA